MINEIGIMINKLGIDELNEFNNIINKKIRSLNKSKKVIYTNDCFSNSEYHFRKNKHWAKVITGIDDNKINGYDFLGEFLKVEKESLLCLNDYIIENCNETLKLYLITGEKEKQLALEGRTNEYATFIKGCKEIIENKKHVN